VGELEMLAALVYCREIGEASVGLLVVDSRTLEPGTWNLEPGTSWNPLEPGLDLKDSYSLT